MGELRFRPGASGRPFSKDDPWVKQNAGGWYLLTAQRSLHPVLSCCLCTAHGTRFCLPGLLGLRQGALAHRGLARGSSSVQCARHARVCTHSRPCSTPYSEVTVSEPNRKSTPDAVKHKRRRRVMPGRHASVMLPQRVCCSCPSAMTVQHARVSEQAQEHTSPNKN